MRVTVLLDDGRGSDNGVVSVMTPVDQQTPAVVASVAPVRVHSTTSAASSAPAPLSESDGDPEQRDLVVLHVGSVYLSVRPQTARVAASAALIPALLSLVWCFPARATPLLLTLLAVGGGFELSWLAFRVLQRIEAAYSHYEGDCEPAAAADNKESSVEEAILNIHAGNARPALAERSSEADSDVQPSAVDQQPTAQFQSAVIQASECFIGPVAAKFCCGRPWVAAMMLALPLTGALVWVEILAIGQWTAALPSRSSLIDPEGNAFKWTYLLATRYAASVAALLTPSVAWFVLSLAQLELFTLLASQALACPLGAVSCSAAPLFFPLFAAGAGLLVLVSCLTHSEPTALVVHSAFAVVGFVWVHGSTLVALSLLDLDDMAASRDVIVAMLVTVWTADAGSLVWRNTIGRCWNQSTPLQARLSRSRDVESSLIGAGAGALAMVAASQLLALPNGAPVLDYLIVAIVAVGFAQLAELVLVMLKAAASTRRSGPLFAGRCGLLDQTAGLLGATLVVAQYVRSV